MSTRPEPPDPPGEFAELTAAQAAAYLGVSRPTFYRRLGQGLIPPATRRIAGLRWLRYELDEAQQKAGAAPTRRTKRRRKPAAAK